MKGFRPGKVPLSLVKRLYGEALAFGVAERSIQETFESEVVKPSEHDVIGAPKVVDMQYEMDGELHAVVRFGIRPTFTVTGISGEKFSKLVHDVTDDEIDGEIKRLREREGELVSIDDPAGEEDFVVVDLQRLDEASRTPLIGQKREEVMFYLADKRLSPEFKSAIVGLSAGASVTTDHDPHSEDSDEIRPYSVSVREVKRLSLPELNDEFAARISQGKTETVDALRNDIRSSIERHWEQQSDELLKGKLIERLLALNPVDVPESLVDMFLDSFVEDLKRNHGDEIPKDFDEQAFRDGRRQEAERQSRWMLVKEQIVEDLGLEVTDEDRESHFELSAGDGGVDAGLLRKYYESVSGMMNRLDSRLLTDKVFETLLADVELEEKDSESYKAEFEAQAS
jgi:trigger factor